VPRDELRALWLSVPDLPATFDRVVATPGVEVWQEPITRAGGARDAVVPDPAGTIVRIAQG
jgi:predicted enzyme related to lactoylglutathione lyase